MHNKDAMATEKLAEGIRKFHSDTQSLQGTRFAGDTKGGVSGLSNECARASHRSASDYFKIHRDVAASRVRIGADLFMRFPG